MKVSISYELHDHQKLEVVREREDPDGTIVELSEHEFRLLRMIIDQYHHIQNYLDDLRKGVENS